MRYLYLYWHCWALCIPKINKELFITARGNWIPQSFSIKCKKLQDSFWLVHWILGRIKRYVTTLDFYLYNMFKISYDSIKKCLFFTVKCLFVFTFFYLELVWLVHKLILFIHSDYSDSEYTKIHIKLNKWMNQSLNRYII